MYCSSTQCDHVQRWKQLDDRSKGSSIVGDQFDWVAYACRNCESETRYFYFWVLPTSFYVQGGDPEIPQKLHQTPGAIQKIGQFPPLEERISKVLAKQLAAGDAGDLDLYRKALRSRNNNYGIGALAYLRRMVENRMNGLLDLIRDAAGDAGLTAEQIKQIEGIKQSRVFDDKVKFAADLLPSHLRPAGHNPIDDLHDLASEGLHRKTDAECIELFDQSRRSFEYLFSELEIQKERAQEFVRDHRKLVERKQQKLGSQ